MFFRDELKETMQALKLTKELEVALKKDGARGNSLSDLVKSYERRDIDDFYEDYEYRAYKRELLGGRYNPLRWVAHERNQLMHQSGYLIENFLKFKYTIKDAIKYLRKKKKGGLSVESFLLKLINATPYIIAFAIPLFLFKDKILAGGNPVIYIIFAIIGLGLIIRLGELFANLLELFFTIYNFLQNMASNHKIAFYTLLLSILLWREDASIVTQIFTQLKELF